ncbi:hypothetical protein BY996DRAFT_6419834 [Phakopsora pachyrhizi]|nr:hypothetical protein BY996DRAFT_6419834 [Phakopsora pachyrhizi]
MGSRVEVVDSDHRRTEPLICRASGQCLNELEFQGVIGPGEGGEGKIANRLLLVLLLRMLLLLTGWRRPLPLRMLLPAKSSLKRSLVEVLVTDRLRSEADETTTTTTATTNICETGQDRAVDESEGKKG